MRIFSSLFVLLFVVGTAAAEDAALDGAGHYQKGIELMDGGGDLAVAEDHFEKAGAAGFQPVGVAYRLARIYARTDRDDAALEQVEFLANNGFGIPALIEGETDFADIADEARFVGNVRKIRFTFYQG